MLWLNGAFGAGKTTTAELLVGRRAELVLVDPEQVGFLLWRYDPALRAQDFRGLRLWRRLVVEHVEGVLREWGRPVVVPMSIFDQVQADELVGELRRRGVVVHHVWLDVAENELRRRILAQRMSDDDATDEGTRQFRLTQLPAALTARTGAVPLRVGARGPDAVVDALVELLSR